MTYVDDKRKKRNLFQSFIAKIEADNWYIKYKDNHWLYCSCKQNENFSYPEKGFKIHLSATINNAHMILKKFYSYGKLKKLEWKVVFDYRVLERQNLGRYGYSQIGKFITIYPKNDRELCETLSDLEIMYKEYRSVNIPSDYSYMNSQVVYYRYGDIIQNKNSNDDRQRMIPEKIHVPVIDYYVRREYKLPQHIIVFDVKLASGKSSVYQVFNTKRRCITFLKSAKFLNNIDIYGVDAVNRLQNEKRVLLKLKNCKYTPKVVDDFYIEDTYFLEITAIPGIPLKEKEQWIRSLSIVEKIDLTLKVSILLKKLIEQGIYYRDLSFSNILIDNSGEVFIIDFEYCFISEDWNLPEIIAGSIGFYTTDANRTKEQQIVFSIVAFLLNLIFFDSYIEIALTDNQSAMERRFSSDFYGESCCKNIFDKAFLFKYRKFEDLTNDLEKLKSGLKYLKERKL